MSKTNKRQKTLDELFSTKKKKTGTTTSENSQEITTTVSKTDHSSNATTSMISKEDLEVLKQFDLDMTFGPCTGITRLDRYERAIRHELEPPSRVLELINLYPNDRQVTHNIWRDYTL